MHSNHIRKRTVSVVIPAHNEEEFITDCILSVKKNRWPPEQLEILVVDHSSTDSTATLARTAGATVLPLSYGSIGTVRNIGLRAATGEFIAYIDADCVVAENWLSTAINLLESDKGLGAVGGPYLAPAHGTWVERSLAPSHLPGGVIKPAKALATGSFIARTSLLREIGEFDETLISGEDDDISNKIQVRGLSLILATDCHVIHRGYPRTWWGVLKKEIWHGSNHIEVRSTIDFTLILTMLFVVASICLPPLLALGLLIPRSLWPYGFSFDLFVQFSPPFLFALKRIRQSARDWRLFFPLLATGYAYFAGHGIGVLTNVWRRSFVRSVYKKKGGE